MSSSKTLPILAGAAALLVISLPAAGAHADVINFTSDFCSDGCGAPPFGSITLTQNGTTVDVDVDVKDFNGNKFVRTGAGVLDTNAFEFNGVGVSLADITVDAHAPTLTAVTGAFGKTAFGSFTFGIQCPTCANGAGGAFSPDIVFHVANATISDLTQLNNKGFNFAVDILSGTTGNTGAVAAPAPSIGHGLSALAAVGGLLLGVRLPGRKRPSTGAAIAQPA